MILCVTVVMIMCCACSVSSNTDMSMNTEGKGVFKTQVMLDKELLEVLLTNIIDNSIKASNQNSNINISGYYENDKYIL